MSKFSEVDPGTVSLPGRAVDTVFVHCTACSSGGYGAEEIDRDHRGRGFSEIGYHWLIKYDGTVIVGRSTEIMPAAQAGYNRGTLAICLQGLERSDFTEAQFRSLKLMADKLDDDAGTYGLRWRGHCEVAAKACPVFDYCRVLGLDGYGRRRKEGSERPLPRKEMKLYLPVLTAGVSHPAVRFLSLISERAAQLVRASGGLRYTSDLVEEVELYQRAEGLAVDGIVGQQTWSDLFDVGM